MTDHPPFVWLNGKLVAWNDATIHLVQVSTAGVSLVYEGIVAYRNDDQLAVFQLEAHVQRFAQSMRLMRMQPAQSMDEIRQGILDLLRANQPPGDVYIRPFAFVDSETYSGVPDAPPSIVIHSKPFASHLKNAKIIHACVSSWTRLNDNTMPPRVKASSNYLNSRYASEEAKRNGYDAAIILQANGKVAEAPGACLMLVRDGKIITPSVTSGILESITRETIIRLCREVLHIQVIEREVDRTELYVADEAFLCGTGSEIAPLGSIDRLTLGDGKMGAVTQQIEKAYHDVVRGIDTRYRAWRTIV